MITSRPEIGQSVCSVLVIRNPTQQHQQHYGPSDVGLLRSTATLAGLPTAIVGLHRNAEWCMKFTWRCVAHPRHGRTVRSFWGLPPSSGASHGGHLNLNLSSRPRVRVQSEGLQLRFFHVLLQYYKRFAGCVFLLAHNKRRLLETFLLQRPTPSNPLAEDRYEASPRCAFARFHASSVAVRVHRLQKNKANADVCAS